jgi:hypothetical protein
MNDDLHEVLTKDALRDASDRNQAVTLWGEIAEMGIESQLRAVRRGDRLVYSVTVMGGQAEVEPIVERAKMHGFRSILTGLGIELHPVKEEEE